MKTPSATPLALPEPPARWAWHYRALLTLRDRLLEERSGRIADATTAVEQHSMDIADSATDEFDHDLALGLLSREQDALYEIESAIHRILDGTYGICEDTGFAICGARLRAMPWARRTREAEERAEMEGADEAAHLGRIASLQGTAPGGLARAEEPESEELLGRELARHKREEDVRSIIEGTGQV